MGVVPMVELANRPLLTGDSISEVSGIAAMQDAMNLLWALQFNPADFTSLPARVVLGADHHERVAGGRARRARRAGDHLRRPEPGADPPATLTTLARGEA